jgi:hypothetical protein
LLEKQIAELKDLRDDLRSFTERINAILQHGYTPPINDGAPVNMTGRLNCKGAGTH